MSEHFNRGLPIKVLRQNTLASILALAKSLPELRKKLRAVDPGVDVDLTELRGDLTPEAAINELYERVSYLVSYAAPPIIENADICPTLQDAVSWLGATFDKKHRYIGFGQFYRMSEARPGKTVPHCNLCYSMNVDTNVKELEPEEVFYTKDDAPYPDGLPYWKDNHQRRDGTTGQVRAFPINVKKMRKQANKELWKTQSLEAEMDAEVERRQRNRNAREARQEKRERRMADNAQAVAPVIETPAP